MAYRDLEKKKKTDRLYYSNNREKLLKVQKQTRINRRNKVISYYGGKCNCCGENLYEFLSIEHLDGGGTKHRKELSSPNIDRWIIKNNYPSNFTILCHNCNFAKGIYGKCPHNKRD